VGVPRLLAELDGATDFHFDSISQVRMDSWSRGRVTLVGDASYSRGRPWVPYDPWPRLQRRLSALQGRPVRMLSAISLKDHQPRR